MQKASGEEKKRQTAEARCAEQEKRIADMKEAQTSRVGCVILVLARRNAPFFDSTRILIGNVHSGISASIAWVVGWVEAHPDGGFGHGPSRAETHHLGRGSLVMGLGAGKIAGASPVHWRASTHPTALNLNSASVARVVGWVGS